jgi:hypothetical protein
MGSGRRRIGIRAGEDRDQGWGGSGSGLGRIGIRPERIGIRPERIGIRPERIGIRGGVDRNQGGGE